MCLANFKIDHWGNSPNDDLICRSWATRRRKWRKAFFFWQFQATSMKHRKLKVVWGPNRFEVHVYLVGSLVFDVEFAVWHLAIFWTIKASLLSINKLLGIIILTIYWNSNCNFCLFFIFILFYLLTYPATIIFWEFFGCSIHLF